MPFLILAVLIIVAVLLFKCIRIVPQSQAYVIEFLGTYTKTLGNGLHFLVPIVERVAKKVSLKEQLADFPPQPVITKDNVTMQVDTVVYFSVVNPQLYCYGIDDPMIGLENLTATTLRNIIGELELDQTLTSRDTINTKMRAILDEATDPWGIKVNRVELKNIIPPKDIQNAMEKQMRAEREKRQTLLESEAHKQSVVLRAEGDKQAMVLQAEAERDAAIARATGEAESIRLIYEAEANGMKLLSETQMSQSAMQLKQLEALRALGDGRATKLVVPTELAASASLLGYVGDVITAAKKDADATPKEEPSDPQHDDCCDDEERSPVTQGLASDRALAGGSSGSGQSEQRPGGFSQRKRNSPPAQESGT